MPPTDDRDLVWKIYVELGAMERHFNELQSRYRALASTWLLAAFGGIGFVLTTELSFVTLPAEWAVALVGLAAAAGVYLLWMLDLLVYHRLLDAAFVEAWRLEERHPWLPQVRAGMMKLQNAVGVLRYVRLFYLTGFGLMATIAAGALVLRGARGDEGWAFVLAAAIALLAGVLGARMVAGTKNTAALRKALDAA